MYTIKTTKRLKVKTNIVGPHSHIIQVNIYNTKQIETAVKRTLNRSIYLYNIRYLKQFKTNKLGMFADT